MVLSLGTHPWLQNLLYDTLCVYGLLPGFSDPFHHITLTIVDQDYRFVQLQDPKIVVQLLIRSPKK